LRANFIQELNGKGTTKHDGLGLVPGI